MLKMKYSPCMGRRGHRAPACSLFAKDPCVKSPANEWRVPPRLQRQAHQTPRFHLRDQHAWQIQQNHLNEKVSLALLSLAYLFSQLFSFSAFQLFSFSAFQPSPTFPPCLSPILPTHLFVTLSPTSYSKGHIFKGTYSKGQTKCKIIFKGTDKMQD